jgi:hypothetical protein
MGDGGADCEGAGLGDGGDEGGTDGAATGSNAMALTPTRRVRTHTFESPRYVAAAP